MVFPTCMHTFLVAMSLARKKLVFVGDAICGKSHLLLTFTDSDYINKSIPYVVTFVDERIAEIIIDNQLVRLHLWDTPGLLTT